MGQLIAFLPLRKLSSLVAGICLLGSCLLLGPLAATATDNPEIFPLSQVTPGMKGEVYTIFEGDKIEKVDLEVIGVLHNAIGPKLDIILVRLLGDKDRKSVV